MPEPVILAAVRTPYGKNRSGAYQATHLAALLACTLQGLVARAACDPAQIEDVIAGCVTQVGEQAADIARQAVLLAGWPVTVPAATVNRFCGSGQEAVHLAARAIAAGDQRHAIGAGIESMSRVPMFGDLGGNFKGLCPALWTQYDLVEQGESAERVAAHWQISRAEADALAAESHRRTSAAAAAGRNAEILPTPGHDAQGGSIIVRRDEAVRAVIDPARMAALRPVFRPAGDGIVTAGNASALVDGSDPVLQLSGVIPATHRALQRGALPGRHGLDRD